MIWFVAPRKNASRIIDILFHLILSLISLQFPRSGKKSVEAAFEVPRKLKINMSEYRVRRTDRAWFWASLVSTAKRRKGRHESTASSFSWFSP
jgi:hypothetical protein